MRPQVCEGGSSAGVCDQECGYLSVAVNVDQAGAEKASIGPERSVLSRTMMTSVEATSTHSPPLDPEWLLLRQLLSIARTSVP